MNVPEDFRHYIILAQTVQHPLQILSRSPGESLLTIPREVPIEGTRNIVQPGGRLGAQIGHVSNIIGVMALKQYLAHELSKPGAYKRIRKTVDFWEYEPQPITRIVKIARDSFELNHVYNLLQKAGVKTYFFMDSNIGAYGPGEVMTVVGTEAISKEDAIGLIDYLPLWDPEGLGKGV